MVTVKKTTSQRAGSKSMKVKNDGTSRESIYPETGRLNLVDAFCEQSNLTHVLFSNIQYTFICCVFLLCVFFQSISTVQWERCFFQQIFQISIKHSTQTYCSSTREVSNHHLLFNFMSRPHIITVNLSRHLLASRAFKVQSKCIYAFDPISLPLYHVAVGLLGSLSVGSNLRPQIEA